MCCAFSARTRLISFVLCSQSLCDPCTHPEDGHAPLQAITVSAHIRTVISWSTYHIFCLFPMHGFNAASIVRSIQVGNAASDSISWRGIRWLVFIECYVCLACVFAFFFRFSYALGFNATLSVRSFQVGHAICCL